MSEKEKKMYRIVETASEEAPREEFKPAKTKTTRAECHETYMECAVLVDVDENGKMIQVRGDPKHARDPTTGPFVCHLGEWAPKITSGQPWRITHPMLRVGERGEMKFKNISWEEAYDIVAEKFGEVKKKYGGLAFAGGGESEYYMFASMIRVALAALGSPNWIDYMDWCGGAKLLSTALTTGELNDVYQWGTDPFNAKCMIIWGSNIAVSHPHQWHACRVGQNRGGKIICIDVMRNQTAEQSDIFLQPKLGTDDWLGLAMLNVIINEELYDKEFVEKYCYGFDKLKTHVQEYTPETAEKWTEIPAQKIREVARLYATTKPGFITAKQGIGQWDNGTQKQRIVDILNVIVGNLDVPGGWQLNKDLGIMRCNEFGRQERFEKWIEPLLKDQIGYPEFPLYAGPDSYWHHASFIKTIQEMADGKIKAFWCCNGNIVVAFPCYELVMKGIKNLDFFLVQAADMNPTVAWADLVLPEAMWSEERRLEVDRFHNSFYVSEPATKPPGEARPPLDVIIHIVNKLVEKGVIEKSPLVDADGNPYKDANDLHRDRLRGTGWTLEDLSKYSQEVGPFHPPIKYKNYATRNPAFSTPTGKVELYSTTLEKLQKKYKLPGYDPMPKAKEPIYMTQWRENPELKKKYPLVFMTAVRIPEFYNCREYRIGSPGRTRMPDPHFKMNTINAKERGIKTDDWCWLYTARGKIRMKATVTEDIQKDAIAIPFGWWYPERGPPTFGLEEVSVQKLIYPEPPYDLTSIPCMKGIIGNVEKA